MEINTAERLCVIRDKQEKLSECRMRCTKSSYDYATGVSLFEFLDGSVLDIKERIID